MVLRDGIQVLIKGFFKYIEFYAYKNKETLYLIEYIYHAIEVAVVWIKSD